MIDYKSRYPRRHFFWVRALGAVALLACSIAFGYTLHAGFLLALGVIGVWMIHQLDERK